MSEVDRRWARREAERRRRATYRRRRLTLLGGVILVAAAVIAALSLGGGSGAGAKRAAADGHHGSGGGHSIGAPVNGEPQAASQAPVPILMYHVIGTPPANAPYPDLWVTPSEFTAQVKWLADNGYSAVTMDQVHKAWFDGGTLPRKPIVISFDDGYAGQYVYARPTLRKYNWPGELYLIVDTLEPGGELTTNEVKAMIADGWELGSHTVHHLDVSTLSGSTLVEEVAGARHDLQKDFGVPVNSFCYPSGGYNAAAIREVKAAGYTSATTTNPGLASKSDPFTLDRIRIDNGDGAAGLARKLENPASAGGGGPA